MQVNSPLTRQKNVELLETISVKDIKKLYERKPNLLKVVEADFGELQEIGFYRCCESGLKFFHPCITASEEYYNQLNDNQESYYPDGKEEYRYASKFVSADDIVLEIGAGKGAFCNYIKSKEYVGLEFSDSAIEIAFQGGINLKKETIEQHASHPGNQEKYSVIVAFQVLEHVANPSHFVEAALQCLREDGILIISVPSEDAFFAKLVNDTLNMPPHHVTRWTDQSLGFLATKFNLQIIDIHHEKVDGDQKALFLYCISLLSSLKLLGIPKKLVDTSLQFSLVSKFSALVSRFLLHGFQDQGLMPDGHSVTVVYHKTT